MLIEILIKARFIFVMLLRFTLSVIYFNNKGPIQRVRDKTQTVSFVEIEIFVFSIFFANSFLDNTLE